MKFRPTWDLSTIPDELLHAEVGRRRRAKAPAATYVNLQPCANCGEPLTTTQRRKPCPKCGHRHPRPPLAGKVLIKVAEDPTQDLPQNARRNARKEV